MSSCQYGRVQPPWTKPPSVSSSGAPGAWITPSSVMNSCTTIFLTATPPSTISGMGKHRQDDHAAGPSCFVERLLEICDDELLHLEHGIHGGQRSLLVRMAQQFPQLFRNDLPRESVPVLEPAALFGLRARRELLPEVVHL